MLNEFPTVDALIDEIKGTTGSLSSLLSRKNGALITLIVFAVLFSKLLFG